MPCDRTFKRGQTISQRKAEVNAVVNRVVAGLLTGKVKAKIGPQGALAFIGLDDNVRDDVSDACIYRAIQRSGSSLAMAQIAKAEAMAGRPVSALAMGQGAHSHDNGVTWHSHK
jgi:hypothetical protein